MKKIVIAGFISAMVTAVSPLSAMAHGTHAKGNTGYAMDTNGDVVTSAYGECWKTTDWTVKHSIPLCEGDDDKDGVANPLDKCPDTPAGDEVDEDGCSITKAAEVPAGPLDSDGDGVTDDMDKCPDTPAGHKVDAVGCEHENLVLENVYFAVDSAKLTAASTAVLDKTAEDLISRTDIVGLIVIGHTDSTASEAYNQKLSEARAKSVHDYLASKGVNDSIITSEGRGESEPVASNATKAGRKQNRRVVIDVQF